MIFVNLLKKVDRPWIASRVRKVNIWLDLALLGYDTSYINAIDTSSITTQQHSVWSAPQCRDALTRLIVQSMGFSPAERIKNSCYSQAKDSIFLD